MLVLAFLILLTLFGQNAAAECACKLQTRPEIQKKAETARWMVHSLEWGVLSTVSSRLGDGQTSVVPFGNVYSFVDGPCDNASGVPYLFGTYMDQSFIDSMENSMVALTLSEASLSSVCTDRDGLPSCMLGTKYGDPENPVCARLTLTGALVVLEEGSEEYHLAQNALFQRHATMAGWPSDHNWVIAKIDIQDIWLIDFFGGASIIDAKEYFGATLTDTDIDAEEKGKL
jgi:hypothetical protein